MTFYTTSPLRRSLSLSFRSMLSLFSSDLAIDLGTANTCVFARGKCIVVNEPSIIAINKVNGRVEAVGKDAKDMLGRTPGNIVAIKPMKDGVIADFEYTEKMLTYFIKKAHSRNVMVRPRIVIGVPSEITQVEKRAVKDSAYRAKASEVHLVEEGDGRRDWRRHADHRAVQKHDRRHRRRHRPTSPSSRSRASCTASRCASRATSSTRRSSSTSKKQHNLLIGERTAEAIKIEVGSVAFAARGAADDGDLAHCI